MNSVRERCRPKHQTLILRCYPRYMKSAAEVKPNSSELSYLLYYSSTRRSKLQKIGAFLERKASRDARKNRTSYIHVTLQITQALIEKNPRDLPLYATYVLKIIDIVLRMYDISTIEEATPVFESFCAHHNVATFAADQVHLRQYESILRSYTSFANLKPPFQPKSGVSAPLAIRWRTAGLQALKSITASDTVARNSGWQIHIILPVILQNLHSNDGSLLNLLQSKSQTSTEVDQEQTLRRRMSVATVRTTTESTRPEFAAIAETTDDADHIAEEEVGMMALKCLQNIFEVNNRVQIRIATTALMDFVGYEHPQVQPTTAKTSKSVVPTTWAVALVEMIAKWVPVQDRFVILVTIVEALVKSPAIEENLERQLILASLVDHLLCSSINMIGLSVMDVLVSLANHVLRLLQLGANSEDLPPLPREIDTAEISTKTAKEAKPTESSEILSNEISPSSKRQDMLIMLQKCIGDLATHIYYSDQIADIVSAILQRLKPSIASGIASEAAAIENPEAVANAISNAAHFVDDPKSETFFAFGAARVIALKTVKEVLLVANAKGSSDLARLGRNWVGVQVWEGTQWLLRDQDRRVRSAYIDALSTWLRLELSPKDLRVREDKRRLYRSLSRNDIRSLKGDSLAKRACSNASTRDLSKILESNFIPYLHLAIYDNACEAAESKSESDILLLHLILSQLVDKLGVNAVKTGLPMIMRLQDDCLDGAMSVAAQRNIGSLIHGYLRAIVHRFSIEPTDVGHAIQSENLRLKEAQLWLDTIQLPPIPLEDINTATSKSLSDECLDTEKRGSFIKFESRLELVDRIADSYSTSFLSPPTSPLASPVKGLVSPGLGDSFFPAKKNELPPEIRESMLSEWSKELCITPVAKATSRSISLVGSRRRMAPPHIMVDHSLLDHESQLAGTARDSISGPSTPLSDENHIAVHVDDLKRALSGDYTGMRANSPLRIGSDHASNDKQADPSDDSDDEGGYELASEEIPTEQVPAPIKPSAESTSPKPTAPSTPVRTISTNHSRNPSSIQTKSRPQSGEGDAIKSPSTPRSFRRLSTSSSAAGEDPDLNAAALRGEIHRLSAEYVEEVPPVPPLPADLSHHRPFSRDRITSSQDLLLSSQKTNGDDGPIKGDSLTTLAGNVRDSVLSSRRISTKKKSIDVQALLGSIDAKGATETEKTIGSGALAAQ